MTTMAEEDENDLDHTTAIRAPETDGHQETKPQAVLLVMTGPTTGQTIYLETKDIWTLGRSNQADVTFADESVSRSHAQIVYEKPDRWVLEDLQSSNGSWINGERTQRHILKSGDKVQLGSTIIVKFVLQDELEAAFQRELYESATKDALTGLYSKRFFLDQFDVEFNFHRRTKKPLSFVICDIDHFKKINDTHGHPAGDHVLRDLGRLFLNVLRRGDMVGRYGGEEIVFFLRETALPGAKTFAERLRKLCENHPFIYESKRIPVTISLGLATYVNENFHTSSDLIKAADQFLYKAKQGGRNRVESLG